MTAKENPAHFVQRAKERAGLTEAQALAVYKDIPRAVAMYDACDPVGMAYVDFMRGLRGSVEKCRLFRIRVATGFFAVVVGANGYARTIITLDMAKDYVPSNVKARKQRRMIENIKSRQTRLPA